VHRLTDRHLRLFNHVLTGVIALLAVYIIAAPFLPQLSWWVRHDSPVSGALPSRDVTSDLPSADSSPQSPAVVPEGEQLIIPGLDMRETIHGGASISALRQGVWRLPHTSSPDKGGNTVLVGHRFTYSGQAVFYHLDKVKKGDPIIVTWQGKVYRYEVTDIKTVKPT